MLELRRVARRFGGIAAVSDVGFTVAQGQVYGVIGPNGSGKTTLLDLICGLTTVHAGEILLDGRRIDRLPAHRIARLGVARTFQRVRLLPESTAREQLLIGQHRRGEGRLWQELALHAVTRRERGERGIRAQALLELARLEHAAGWPVQSLSAGEQRRLEIARALAQAPEYLLLDEPAAGMSAGERDDLHRLFGEIVQGGVTILVVEHRVDFVMAVCDRVAVLDHGVLRAEGPAREIRADPVVREVYLGTSLHTP